jgi:hypothetical protein
MKFLCPRMNRTGKSRGRWRGRRVKLQNPEKIVNLCSGCFDHSDAADCQSAIQQAASLRYLPTMTHLIFGANR